jgi:hypothetical protein
MRFILIGFAWALAAGMAAEPGAQVQFEYVAAELGGGVVKDAPYSAEAVTEITQTLADGNRIVQKNAATIYRDSQGRTRREQTLGAIGPLAVQAAQPLRVITISDPVAGVSYTLDPQTQTAAKIPLGSAVTTSAAGGAGPAGHATGDVIFMAAPNPQPQPAPGRAVVRTTVIRHAGAGEQGKAEQLGTQVIEGVEAQGTREIVTIPAGEIGNERPIEVTSERWYSPRLQTVVMSKRNDPRMGETVYRLTNINLGEPAASLFQVPAGYTVKEGPQMIHFERKMPESK